MIDQLLFLTLQEDGNGGGCVDTEAQREEDERRYCGKYVLDLTTLDIVNVIGRLGLCFAMTFNGFKDAECPFLVS